jgi:zinc finger protein ZFPM1
MRATAVEDFQDKIDENFNASQKDNNKEHVTHTPRPSDKLPKTPQVLTTNLEMPPRLAMFICGPCGIRFSSASTLEAHQTYYCSHRKDQDENGVTAKPSADGSIEPAPKSIKTGKQYACSQCSYSADKKVSLNRHMRMHQASPSPSSNTSNGGDDTPSQITLSQKQQQQPPTQQLSQQQQLILQQQLQQQQHMQQQQQQPIVTVPLPQIDRYCSDCDIRFSSTKTYRAHKLHYCSSRHREGG